MNRSSIPQEKISNNLTFMNHHAMNDDENFSVSKTFVNSGHTSSNLKVDNREISDHVYENVPLPHVGKKKHKNLSELVGNLRSKTRELKLRVYARNLKARMIENRSQFDKNLISSSSSTIHSDYQQSENDDEDIYSYTACQEENIYENLNFDFQHNWRENDTVLESDSLKYWLDDLTAETSEYESDQLMISKCIPSRQNNLSCSLNFDAVTKASAREKMEDLERYKLEIITKCFGAVWNQETENEILNGLYVFLNDIFASYFRKNAAINNRDITRRDNSSSVRKRRKRRVNSYDAALFMNIDKKTKFESFILSLTLNRATITYDKCLKFYFVLESCPSSSTWSTSEIKNILNLSKVFIATNCRKFEITNRKQLRFFLKTLKQIFLRSARVTTIASVESPISDVLSDERNIVKEENIYNQIWKWRTDSQSINICDNIYPTLDFFVVESDDNDWEIDSEFCFLDAKLSEAKRKNHSMYQTVCILYSHENPDLNQILYSYNSADIISECEISKRSAVDSDEEIIKGFSVAEIKSPIDDLDSVSAWKNLIRSAFYMEDEEDVIMSETQISSLKRFQPQPEEPNTRLDNEKNDKKDVLPSKSKLITISNGSYELKSAVSEPIIETSVHGNYRNFNESDSNNNSLDSSVELTEEPKKEREKFRDKMKVKFKLKSSKTTAASQESVEVQREVEEDYFGNKLDTTEKDSIHKNVPKIVVECVSAIENEQNIETPGLYRVSGNKTLIEAFKKKNSEKKSSKKDLKHASLRSQDVHCVTGILKLFFRELSPPLMPSYIFMSCTSDNVNYEQIAAILEQMPLNNYQTLKFLMAHLKKVEQFKKDNLMDAKNLAICWGLCLFSSSFDSTNQFFENDISKCNMLCKKMIDNFGVIFRT